MLSTHTGVNSLKLKVRNSQWPIRDRYFFEVSEFNYYEGDEVKVKWCKPEEIAVSTGNPEFAFRIIQRAHIAEIDGKPYSFTVKKADTVRIVKGSNGKEYEVTGNYKCTCPGFTFRGTCKHLETK